MVFLGGSPQGIFSSFAYQIFMRHFFQIGLLGMLLCGLLAFSPLTAQPFPTPSETPPEGDSYLEIQYFSVGCFKLKYGESALLTDPFWTHLPALKVMFGKVLPDSAQIEPYLPPLDDIDGVLVCHAHYDHVLGLPYISPRLPFNAPVIGSKTMRHTLAPFHLPQPIVEANPVMATPNAAGQFIPLDEGRIRVLPVKAGHPNHLLFIHLWNQELTEDRKDIPTRGRHYQEGVTLGFLIDFLSPDGQNIEKRVFFQSSSTPYPAGFFPREILKEKSVDVALLGRDFFEMELNGERNAMPWIGAETVILCHWENFFKPKSEGISPKLVQKYADQIRELQVRQADGPRYILPTWDGKYYF